MDSSDLAVLHEVVARWSNGRRRNNLETLVRLKEINGQLKELMELLMQNGCKKKKGDNSIS